MSENVLLAENGNSYQTDWSIGYLHSVDSANRSWQARAMLNQMQSVKASVYNFLQMEQLPSNSKERLLLIVELFDRWPVSVDRKRNALKHLKQMWSVIYNEPEPFKWLGHSNSEQVDWAWNYVKKNMPHNLWISPIDSSDNYRLIYLNYDLWSATPEARKLFLISFNKAWS